MFKAIYIALLLCIALAGSPVRAQPVPMIRYQKENGFPSPNAYCMMQDHAGYIWIGTENGLARFNGYEFKLFTTRDGLPDNEILDLKEDDFGRLWFIPFSNAIGYIKNGVIHTRENDPLLKQLHFDTNPIDICSDRYGNTMVAERGKVTCITPDNQVKCFLFKSHGYHNSIFIFRTAKGTIQLLDTARKVFQYDNSKWVQVAQLPWLDMKICHFLVSAIGLEAAQVFFKKIVRHPSPVYSERAELDKINFIVSQLPGKLAMLRTDGCFLIDSASTKITDTLLYGYPVSGSMVASDQSLWLGTQSHGVFRLIHSPVKSLPLPGEPAAATYIRGKQNSMYATVGKGRYIEAALDQYGVPVSTTTTQLLPMEPFRYLGKTRSGDWIGCGQKVYRYGTIGKEPLVQTPTWAIKDVLEQDSTHLLIATAFYLHRFNCDQFEMNEALIKKRLTAVALCDGKIYLGTLNGLLVNDSSGHFRKIFATNPAVNTHLLKLCTAAGNTVWLANNKGELIGIQGERIIAQVGEKEGLQCNRIAAIKISEKFIWAGTDNGLYMIQNEAPYRIVKHLAYATGLHTDEITCLDISGERVWVGTTGGINYFNEQDILKQSIEPRLIINRISNGGNILLQQGKSAIELSDEVLTIDFDIIDHEGGQKPSYQYRLNNDSSWIPLKSNTLLFAKAPYGHFTISIRGNSPNWKQPSVSTLHFYQAYPIYLRWWFLALVLLALAAAGLAAIVLFLRSARRKDEEKVAAQRQLLQLEQMALQAQMNPHFIFNCIAAIKQYYSSGDHARANEFVDRFSALIRQTFEMGAQLFIPLDKELNYLAQYLAIEQTRFDHSFDFSVSKDIRLPASSIHVPVMLLQPLAENAVRHGIRHLTDRRGKVSIHVAQDENQVTIEVTDNGVGRATSKSFSQFLQNIVPLTSTTVNSKRIALLNQLLGEKIAYHTTDIVDLRGKGIGTKVTISYPLSIHQLQT